MTEGLTRSSLITGIGIFLISFILIYFKAGWLLLYFIALVPGFLYGAVVVNETDSKYPSALFVVASGILHIVSFYLIDIFDDSIRVLLRLWMASTLNTLLLFVLYYTLVNNQYKFFKTALYAFISGAVSSVPAIICMYFFLVKHIEILLPGIFSIYPIWQLSFSYVLKRNILPILNEKSALEST